MSKRKLILAKETVGWLDSPAQVQAEAPPPPPPDTAFCTVCSDDCTSLVSNLCDTYTCGNTYYPTICVDYRRIITDDVDRPVVQLAPDDLSAIETAIMPHSVHGGSFTAE